MATIAGLFNRFEDADCALHDLERLGYCNSEISVVLAKDSAIGHIQLDHSAALPTITGAVFGGLTGLLAGVSPLIIPGIGVVISTGLFSIALASTAAGAGVGALSGGILGALINMCIPELEANIHIEGIKNGGVLVTVKTDADRIAEIKEIFKKNTAFELDTKLGILERVPVEQK